MMSSSENSGVGKMQPLDCSPGSNRKKTPQTAEEKRRHFRHSDSDSDSDISDDSPSMSSSQVETTPAKLPILSDLDKTSSTSKSTPPKGRKRRKQRHDWEIVEGLKDGYRCAEKPEKYQGFMLKRRRWPMKGWHKRYFSLEKGFLLYTKSPFDMQKSKYHGVIDVGMSVVAFKQHQHRIYIDAEDIVYHIKVKDERLFAEWLNRIRHHRLYRQHELTYGTKDSPRLTEITSPTKELPPLTTCTRGGQKVRQLNEMQKTLNLPEKARERSLSKDVIRQSSFKGRESSQNRVATWLLDTAGFEHCNKELLESQSLISDLHDDLEQIRNLPLAVDSTMEVSSMSPVSSVSNAAVVENMDNEVVTNDKKKTRGLRSSKKKEKKNDGLGNQDFPENLLPVSKENIRTSCSNPNLVQYEHERSRPRSVPDYQTISSHEHRIKEMKLREGFINKADHVCQSLSTLCHMMGTERDRLKRALEVDNGLLSSAPSNTVLTLKQNLAEAHRQIGELKTRLSRIHEASSVSDYNIMTPSSPILSPGERECHGLSQSMSAESCSISEYYDAEEYNKESGSESSTEASDDDDVSSEAETDFTPALSVSEDQLSESFQTGRRSKLPVPKPDTGDVSLWNLLYKNLGKDLTKISMPVTLNEPLSMLQRLCEELEYSELLERAVDINDPYERMMYVAAFAVSSYASSGYRTGHKPFNPVLGETYECIREDKGWKFVAEQVSHHPPISACYCESKNYIFSQDARIKTKFWGKSMEIQPLGTVSLKLPKFKDHYQWNKVTTCVHNLLGGTRWVDQYGEMQIKNGDILCKMTFTKANHWSGKRHDVFGHILNAEGKVVLNLFGKWNEALYCGSAPSTKCIWRPGAMPDDFELYYGFTRFAIELNELDPEQAKSLPPTDSRFRPDQRLLEEGKIQESDSQKHHVEHLQRERRKNESKIDCQPKWFRKMVVGGKETYEYNGKYWEMQKDPGFNNLTFPKLW